MPEVGLMRQAAAPSQSCSEQKDDGSPANACACMLDVQANTIAPLSPSSRHQRNVCAKT